MGTEDDTGVVFRRAEDGSRSTSAVGRAVVTAALRDVDPAGALAAERETNWRSGYLDHVAQLTVAGLSSRDGAVAIARDGLAAVHAHMRVVDDGGDEHDLDVLRTLEPDAVPATEVVRGDADPEEELVLAYRGEQLRGDALAGQLDRWVADGILEPSAAESVREVMAHPEWLRLDGRTVVVLGAGAEMGPLPALLRWGATVAGVDLRRPELWRRVLDTARRGAGTLLVPVDEPGDQDGRPLEERAGLDLIREVPATAEWIAGLEGTAPVLGNYVYADGATHVRAAVAVDALTCRVHASRPDVALAFLATPTDVFAVPASDVDKATAAYEGRSRTAKLMARPLRTLSAGRLLRRGYAPGVDPGICDALVPQQGPNYALAKRIHRWRATVARADGGVVSLHVAPATRTRSVMKNRALAAAYAGAHRFGVEIFDPDTTNTLMAALLVADLHHGGGPTLTHVWQEEAHAAVHGGLWTCPYGPRSALGLAALLGLSGARS
ncbi:hypothetical protein [Euzebya sp.]|uniref:hypothetical protein n=1 Tax=Euzebya sp. TaxID=1971409 RepID=UPI003512359A